MNIVVDKYVIKIADKFAYSKIKNLEFYHEYPELFFKAYTNLSKTDIKEILNDTFLTYKIVDEVYKNLNVNDEKKFIKTVNNTIDFLNSIDGIFVIYLNLYYEHPLPELLKLSSEELLIMFIYDLKLKRPIRDIDVEELKDILKSNYSEKTANDFIEYCCANIQKQNEENFNKELEELQNL